MAKRTKSALKANRQNIKRREHNRQMRSRAEAVPSPALTDNASSSATVGNSASMRSSRRRTRRLSSWSQARMPSTAPMTTMASEARTSALWPDHASAV